MEGEEHEPCPLPSSKVENIRLSLMAGLNMAQRRRMDKVVKAAKATHDFNETYTQRRNEGSNEDTETPSVFNKRHFISRSSVIITKEARKIMDQNARHVVKDTRRALAKSELRVMSSVVEGLKLIHRGLDHVKEALSGVVSYESYTSSKYITNSTEGMDCSCYYIINGAVEVTYDMKNSGKSRSVYQPNILYSHGAAEYIGLVSPEGVDDDLAPPATIYSREPTQILRINRYKFHKEVNTIVELLSEEKRRFLRGPACKIPLPDDIVEKILDKLTKQEYSSNKIILEQDYISDEMFLIVSGRCQLVRYISIPESKKRIQVVVGVNCGGDFFGDECILDRKGSYCEVMATSQTVCYKLHRSALEIVQKEYLYNHIKEMRNEYPEEDSLLELGHRACMWNYYKHKQVKSALEEHGKLKYLYVPETRRILERPPSTKLQYNENLLRFIEKGAKFEKFKPRSQSAKHTSSSTRTRLQRRPRTVLVTMGAKRGYENDMDRENVANDKNESFKEVRFPKEQKPCEKEEIRESHEKQLARLLSQNSDVGRQMRMAWEENEKENSGFTKSGVLATMKTEDIVRKAKQLAEKQSEKIQTGDTGDFDEEWHTSVHEENENAKMFIAASKYRLAILRRKIKAMNYNKERREVNKKLTTLSNENRKLSYGNFVIDYKSESESESDSEDIIADSERKQHLENWVKTDEDDDGNNEQTEPNPDDPVEKFKKAVESVDVANNSVFSRRMTIPWIKKKFMEQEKETEQLQKVLPKRLEEDVNHVRFATISRRPHSSFVLSRPNHESRSGLLVNGQAMVDRPKTAVTTGSGRLAGRHFKDVGIMVKNSIALKGNKGTIQRISSKEYTLK